MNIDLLCSSPINIMLGVINGSCSCSFLIRLITIVFKNLLQVVHKIRIEDPNHYDIDFVFLHIIF
jgi:hypothetical protein